MASSVIELKKNISYTGYRHGLTQIKLKLDYNEQNKDHGTLILKILKQYVMGSFCIYGLELQYSLLNYLKN